jgi:triacylglycerol esterase/lipase EstA (alpha/beta hydrolase family)
VISTSKNGLTDFFQVSMVMASVIWQMACAQWRGFAHTRDRRSVAVTHDRYALLLCLFLVHYPAPAVAVVTGSTYGPFSMALLAEYPNLLPDRLHLLPV